ncbi:MAG: bifunctional [glutamate--ammonia ligase]-adenylyl-L-tyrosine phosphorylase/[glutamate--ammonia-ligase] adenylyltransferase [Marinagarivorans sp.]|nr:bifunctional [glutamate--ammonia ligase]-adenylyl-L-tyrosine phosphorylase/[glutamate--ammonia-ligase] adenylyltransferase [Marinagarivorans sp.]
MMDLQTDLINLLSIPLDRPNASLINAQVELTIKNYESSGLSALTTFFNDQITPQQWQKVLSCSEFARKFLLKTPQRLTQISAYDLTQNWGVVEYQTALTDALAATTSLVAMEQGLRQWRNAMMVRSIWRDLNRLAPTLAITAELTAMADVAIAFVLNYHYQQLADLRGVPSNSLGQPQPMLVIGMGKLGAHELNLSSDIDLIFAYPEAGETLGKSSAMSNQEFFTQLGQRLIKSLDAVTAEGFVFRVDMRLRPYGQDGALVSSFDGLEHYYLTQGRDWERYAMVKARVVAQSDASPQHAKELMQLLRSFTYRKYVDFSAIEALRDLKARIRQEVKRRRLQDNVKLGEGGIREVEFIVQALQLIRGGRDSQLQTQSLFVAINELVKLKVFPQALVNKLFDSYCFLRNAEHAIQAWQDQQTQELPTEPNAQWALAHAMDFEDWASFKAALAAHMTFVSQQFSDVIHDQAARPKDEAATTQAAWRELWLERDVATLEQLLADQGMNEAVEIVKVLERFHQSPQLHAADKTGGERLQRFMPLLLGQLAGRNNIAQTLQRLQPFVLAVARRSAYLLLLIENAAALEQLIILSEASPWIPERLAQHPALLDELLSPASLYEIPNADELMAELQQTMLRITDDDLEQQLEALRYFQQAHSLKVAACEVTGKLPLMKVSDYLTELAEVLLNYCLKLAWRIMVAKHGLPGGQTDDQPHLIVVGYGKLGGLELGHNSDLDLVFIYSADNALETQAGAGQKAIDNQTFYTRLGQKLIHLMATRTPSGILYEIDMRLRPNGNSGMLVATLSAFEKYQRESAWTWEHQALVRARVVAGWSRLADEFRAVREAVLCQPRELSVLAKDVADMRQKMRSQLGSNQSQQEAGDFDLKQDAGGIVDIEFMVQYAVLAHAHSYPALTRYSDNIRILDCLDISGLLSAQEAAELTEAYKVFRATMHRLALQQQSARVAGYPLAAERKRVVALWQKLLP